MADEPEAVDLSAAVAEMIEFLTLRADGDGWIGDTPDWFGEFLFGGFVIAQAIVAATRDAPDGRRLHSMHAYFLRPVTSKGPISYGVRTLREGRAFTTRRIEASQFGKPVLDLTCSFSNDAGHDVYVYDLPSRRTGCGSASRPRCPTTSTSTPRCSASRPTGPTRAAGRYTSTATSEA